MTLAVDLARGENAVGQSTPITDWMLNSPNDEAAVTRENGERTQ
jgi:hypothetical protein